MTRGRVTFFYFASSTFVVSPYSILTATIGSTLVALHPGTNAATTTVSKSTTTAPPKLTGSLTPTPTNMLPTSLPIIKLNPTPTLTPHAPDFDTPSHPAPSSSQSQKFAAQPSTPPSHTLPTSPAALPSPQTT